MLFKIILFVSFFCSANLLGQNRCYIKTNPQECANCINGGKISLESIDKTLQPTFVFENIYEDQVPRFFKDILQLTWRKDHIIISDSLFKKLNTSAFSEIHIVNQNGQSLFKCAFKDLQSNLGRINSYKPLVSKTIIDVPDSIIFSRTTKLVLGKDDLLLHDYQFNDIYFANLTTNKLYKHVKAKDVDLKSMMNLYFNRNYEYNILHRNIGLMQKMGKDKIKFEVVWAKSDTFYTFLNIPHLIIESKNGKNDAIIDQVYMILAWFKGEIVSSYPVDHLKSNIYEIDQANYFFMHDHQFYLSVFKNNLKYKTPFLGIFSIGENKRVSFDKYLNNNLPKLYKTLEWDYVNVDFVKVDNLLFFKYSDKIINIDNNKQYTLSLGTLTQKKEKDVNVLYSLLGTLKKDDNYHIFYSYNNVFQVAKLNSKDFSIKEKKTVSSLDLRNYKSNLILKNPEKIITLNNFNDVISIELN